MTQGEYEGGGLELLGHAAGKAASSAQGTLLVFPSYAMHRVTPVRRGKRVPARDSACHGTKGRVLAGRTSCAPTSRPPLPPPSMRAR